MPEIITNRLNCMLDYNAINQAYDIIKFERTDRKNKWYGAHYLDKLLNGQCKAEAVFYAGYSPYAFALFKKRDNVWDLISDFRDEEDSVDLKIRPVQAVPEIQNWETDLSGSWLVQLLLNALSSSKSSDHEDRFSNLTGSLYYLPHLFNGSKRFVEVFTVRLEKDFTLKVHVKTFKRINSIKDAGRKPVYVIRGETGSMQRFVGDKPQNDC